MAGRARNGATHAADLARSKNEGGGGSVRKLRRSVSLPMLIEIASPAVAVNTADSTAAGSDLRSTTPRPPPPPREPASMEYFRARSAKSQLPSKSAFSASA